MLQYAPFHEPLVNKQHLDKETTKMKKLLIIIGAAAMLAPLLASADGYQFIISGDPVAAATVNSYAAVSSGKALMTDTISAKLDSKSLEARFRTWCESLGRALRSDEWILGVKISFR